MSEVRNVGDPGDLEQMFDRLETPRGEFADLWGADKRRLRRWLAGEEDVPAWMENAVEVGIVLTTLRRMLHAGSNEPARALVADALERFVGGRHAGALAVEFGRPIFVCPQCAAVSFNTNDALNGWCDRCKGFTRSPPPAPT